jgi:hypothetical protein
MLAGWCKAPNRPADITYNPYDNPPKSKRYYLASAYRGKRYNRLSLAGMHYWQVIYDIIIPA